MKPRENTNSLYFQYQKGIHKHDKIHPLPLEQIFVKKVFLSKSFCQDGWCWNNNQFSFDVMLEEAIK